MSNNTYHGIPIKYISEIDQTDEQRKLADDFEGLFRNMSVVGEFPTAGLISDDGGKTWLTPEQFVAQHPEYDKFRPVSTVPENAPSPCSTAPPKT